MIPEIKSIAHGLSDNGLVDCGGGLLREPAALAFRQLQRRAEKAGFAMTLASGFRSYERQLMIFNNKARGVRPVVDDHDCVVDRAACDDQAWLEAILRFSALPGTSRHHWGTDFDVYDAAGLADGCSLALAPWEYQPGGPFAAFNAWLTDLLLADDAEGFFRPYAEDCGGVAPEAWHLSHRSSAAKIGAALDADFVLQLWRGEVPEGPSEQVALLDVLERDHEALWQRFVVV